MAEKIQFTRAAQEQLHKFSRRNQHLIGDALDVLQQKDFIAALYLLERKSKGEQAKLLTKDGRMIWRIHVRQFQILCAVEGDAFVVAAILNE